jgi:hypothetical protein
MLPFQRDREEDLEVQQWQAQWQKQTQQPKQAR